MGFYQTWKNKNPRLAARRKKLWFRKKLRKRLFGSNRKWSSSGKYRKRTYKRTGGYRIGRSLDGNRGIGLGRINPFRGQRKLPLALPPGPPQKVRRTRQRTLHDFSGYAPHPDYQTYTGDDWTFENLLPISLRKNTANPFWRPRNRIHEFDWNNKYDREYLDSWNVDYDTWKSESDKWGSSTTRQ